jgi:glycogen debranching enzyme
MPKVDIEIPNRFAAENTFIGQPCDTSPLPKLDDLRHLLPEPRWEGHQNAIDTYWTAWRLGFRNLRQPKPDTGFVSIFIDSGFGACLYMWDSAFSQMWTRYGRRAFDFQRTLDNFYAKQHKDGYISREIDPTQGGERSEKHDPQSTGPNVIPWSEWEYYLNYGDRERLARVFPPLLAYYQWYRANRSWPDGTYWAAGWIAMDNQPRLPPENNTLQHQWWTHGHMSWVETTIQQIMTARQLLRMADILGRRADVADLEAEAAYLTRFVNENLWDDAQAYYFDRWRDGRLNGCKSVAGYWALLAGITPPERVARFVEHLRNPAEFNRPHRVPTLSADNPIYNPHGDYWRGSIWAPTNYMILRGLTQVGEDALAHEIALNHLDNVVKVHEQTNSLWENYAPESAAPGSQSVPGYVGWSGLPAVSVLLEYVLGLRPDVPSRRLVWDVRLLEEHGVIKYPFGANGLLHLVCARRHAEEQEPTITAGSKGNLPVELEVRWKGGSKVILVNSDFPLLYAPDPLNLPRNDTHIPNRFVAENVFLKLPTERTPLPTYESARALLPVPLWAGHQPALDCYWKVWQIAFSNLRQPNPASGFVANFIDTAFNGCLFMWDSVFILMFGRYGRRAFDFQRTLDNFYGLQHKDGYICREIIEETGEERFWRYDAPSTGPNVMAWSEWEYFLNSGNRERLAQVFPALVAYYQWFRTYRGWPDGSYWSSGWGCGMDNQPRLPEGVNEAWAHGHMTWVDATLQQILAGQQLLRMADALGRHADIADIEAEVARLSTYVNTTLWDDAQAYYFDRWRDGRLNGCKSVAAYWALLADVVPAERRPRLIAHLRNPAEFNRPHRVPTLSADHPAYHPEGEYWRGGIWAPTNYMILRGLTQAGEDDLAHEIALNHLDNVVKVYQETGTVWENYAPERASRGNISKGDFVGWTGVPPVAVLFEYVFGLRPDVPNGTLLWDVRLLEEHGVQRYPYGVDGLLDLHCAARRTADEEPAITASGNAPVELVVRWQGGEKRLHLDGRGCA